MSDFWNMPNPLSPQGDYLNDLLRLVDEEIASKPEPLRGAMEAMFAQHHDLIVNQVFVPMLQRKADADHRLVLTAIASELAQKGIDVGSPPW